jgi:hypothetical protein
MFEQVQEAIQLIQYIKYAKDLDSFYEYKISAKRRQLDFVYHVIKKVYPEFAGLEVINEYRNAGWS